MPTQYKISAGRRYPHGAIPDQCGVNFSIFGLHATCAELLLYERPDSPEPFQVIARPGRPQDLFLSGMSICRACRSAPLTPGGWTGPAKRRLPDSGSIHGKNCLILGPSRHGPLLGPAGSKPP